MLTGLLANALGYDAPRRGRAAPPAGPAALRGPARSRGPGAGRLPDRRDRQATTRCGRRAACRPSVLVATAAIAARCCAIATTRRTRRSRWRSPWMPAEEAPDLDGWTPRSAAPSGRCSSAARAARRPRRCWSGTSRGTVPRRSARSGSAAPSARYGPSRRLQTCWSRPRTIRASPTAAGTVEVADRRDWRLGFHAGLGRRRELRVPVAEGA